MGTTANPPTCAAAFITLTEASQFWPPVLIRLSVKPSMPADFACFTSVAKLSTRHEVEVETPGETGRSRSRPPTDANLPASPSGLR
jgi:hypothetical protein